MSLLRLLAAFVRRDFLAEASYRSAAFFRLAAGLFSLWTFYFLSRTVGPHAASMAAYGGDYFRFALVGSAVAMVLRATLGQFSRAVRDAQLSGSLEALFATPVRPVALMVGAASYTLLVAFVQAVALLAAGAWVFGADLSHANLPAAALSLTLGLLAFGSLGLVSAAFVVVFKRGDPVAWALDAGTALLSGVFYPVEVLPPWMQALGKLVPATHALHALRRNLLFGDGPAAVADSLLALVVCGAVGSALAVVALQLALRRAQRDGSLSHA